MPLRHVIFKIPNLKSELSGRREKCFEWERWSVKTTATSLPSPAEIHLAICGLVVPFNSIYWSAPQTQKKKSLEFLKPISFNFKKVHRSGQGNYASGAPRLWSPRSFNKTKFFFFCFFNLVFDQRNLYVTLFTKKKGFDEFGVRCWDLELDWWVLVSFLCWVGKDCGALGYLGYWIWSSCWLQLPRNSSSNINEDIQPCKSEFTIR